MTMWPSSVGVQLRSFLQAVPSPAVGSFAVTVVLLLLPAWAAGQASAQPRDCLPLTATGTQGGALLPGASMNVRFGGTERSPLALDVYPHAGTATRPLAVVLRGGKGTIGQRSSYVGQL